MKMLKLYTQTS